MRQIVCVVVAGGVRNPLEYRHDPLGLAGQQARINEWRACRRLKQLVGGPRITRVQEERGEQVSARVRGEKPLRRRSGHLGGRHDDPRDRRIGAGRAAAGAASR